MSVVVVCLAVSLVVVVSSSRQLVVAVSQLVVVSLLAGLLCVRARVAHRSCFSAGRHSTYSLVWWSVLRAGRGQPEGVVHSSWARSFKARKGGPVSRQIRWHEDSTSRDPGEAGSPRETRSTTHRKSERRRGLFIGVKTYL